MTQTINFRASWTPYNVSINPNPPCHLLIRIARIMKNILLFIPLFIPRLIASFISKNIYYPATTLTSKAKQTADKAFNAFWKAHPNTSDAYQNRPNLLAQSTPLSSHPYGSWAPYEQLVAKAIQSSYEAKEITLQSPDKTLLKGHYLKHARSHEPNARVILIFGGNIDLYSAGGTCAPLLELLHNHPTPYSFLLMDPRGVGKSSGSINPQGLVIDGDSLYQYAQNLGYSENRIDLYGHSMGGAVAAQLKTLHPQTGGVTILDRTFSTLNAMSMSNAQDLPCSPVRSANWFCNVSGWNFNNVEMVRKIKDPVYIYNHEEEYMMKHKVDLLSACRAHPQSNVHLTELANASSAIFSDQLWFLRAMFSEPHMAPLPLCYRKGAFLSDTDTNINAQALCLSELLRGPFPTSPQGV